MGRALNVGISAGALDLRRLNADYWLGDALVRYVGKDRGQKQDISCYTRTFASSVSHVQLASHCGFSFLYCSASRSHLTEEHKAVAGMRRRLSHACPVKAMRFPALNGNLVAIGSGRTLGKLLRKPVIRVLEQRLRVRVNDAAVCCLHASIDLYECQQNSIMQEETRARTAPHIFHAFWRSLSM